MYSVLFSLWRWPAEIYIGKLHPRCRKNKNKCTRGKERRKLNSDLLCFARTKCDSVRNCWISSRAAVSLCLLGSISIRLLKIVWGTDLDAKKDDLADWYCCFLEILFDLHGDFKKFSCRRCVMKTRILNLLIQTLQEVLPISFYFVILGKIKQFIIHYSAFDVFVSCYFIVSDLIELAVKWRLHWVCVCLTACHKWKDVARIFWNLIKSFSFVLQGYKRTSGVTDAR